ncbi:MAG: aminotransferase class I/II-fold pyridoxal phosphate-dependent enzyme [Hyphomicrobium aestuarii]|nr:aminotransferase class I/II-fold pyridoxal phosphate-dependent enzyme [Hyphomicrobium aestuarii]
MSENEQLQSVAKEGDWTAASTETRATLTTGLKTAVLKVANAIDGAARSTVAQLQPGRRRPPRFRDHALYQSMMKYRLLGDTLGLEDPFFHEHDSRLGATTMSGGRTMINFGGYDYCGLNSTAQVAEAAHAAIDQYGTSVSASRVVAGERPVHREFERELADFYGTEDALTFVSGHATNVSTIATLVGEGDVIFHDELVHNSAIVGAKLSGAEVFCFPHNNCDALQRLMMEHRGRFRNAMVVVEGHYSMDGDIPDLPRMVEIKNRFGAWLMVDEAHSLGVLGATGRGAAEHFGIAFDDIDIWMGTLSKTLASCGGYICGSKELITILKFKAPGFVYSVGLPAPATAAALAALRVLKAEPERVTRLQANGQLFLEQARLAGFDTGSSQGYCVVPLIIGDGIKAVKMTERLAARGVNALPIIYPAVPMKAARLRYFITSEHTAEQIIEAVRITAEELKVVNSLGGILRRAPAVV